MDKKGDFTFFLPNLSISHCQKVCAEALNLPEKLGYRKKIMKKRGYHDFPRKIVGITVSKKFVGVTFVF